MIAGIIIGAIVLFLLLLLLIPVKVIATMEDTLSLKIQYAFLKIQILPAKEKSEKPEKEKKEKKKKEKVEGEEKKPSFLKRLKEQHGLSGLLHLAVELAKLAVSTLRSLFSHIVVYHLHMDIKIGTDNAADTATLHGKVCAVLDSCAAAFLPIIPQKKRKDVKWSILPDFVSERTNIKVFAVAGIRPLFVFSAVFRALFRFVRIYMAANKESKAKENYETTTLTDSNKAV